MKFKVYIRAARGRDGAKVSATTKPNYKPLTTGSGYREKPLPTATFAIEIDIPDAAFKRAEQVIASLSIPEASIAIAADVTELQNG